MDPLDYIERETAKNMDFHLKNMECLNKEAHVTLSFLFVVISACFAGAIRFHAGLGDMGYVVALGLMCAYLIVLALYLAYGCLKVEDVAAPANEPKNLKLSLGEYGIDDIREVELENLQQRIDFNQARNARIGEKLNRVRLLICAGPLVFVLALSFPAIISALAKLQWF